MGAWRSWWGSRRGCCLLPVPGEEQRLGRSPHAGAAGEPPNPKPRRQSWGSGSWCTPGSRREGGTAVPALAAEGGDPVARRRRGWQSPAPEDTIWWPRAPTATFLPQNEHRQQELANSSKRAVHETHRTRHSSHSNLNLLLIRNHSSVVPIYFPFLIYRGTLKIKRKRSDEGKIRPYISVILLCGNLTPFGVQFVMWFLLSSSGLKRITAPRLSGLPNIEPDSMDVPSLP